MAAPLENVYEEIENTNTPPEPTVLRRAASYSDFYRIVRAQFAGPGQPRKKKAVVSAAAKKEQRQWDALMLFESSGRVEQIADAEDSSDALDQQLLDSAQEDYLCVPLP